ncbi:phytanoyl-CoA dioxygenase family protein [Mesorhizobium sp. STM 4661]|uniref:phytanoyl-CoA dioxygenase family protein n=1 Tax=Mesorhizobium sp. STM 4661 TaxID=1297570 RepID=UPI0002BD34E1|nr:phytanoyl-CoA dioxygenase family protein [Mesorhizobium sp. STM 4661]CCV13731.1 Phytanoyl-CoA dioxygenase [Mesorhizobium sp. STM 4661]
METVELLKQRATERARQVVGPAEIEAYRCDGAVCLRGIFLPDEVELCRAGIAANMAAPSERANVASRPDDPGYFIEDFCNWQTNRSYHDFIFNSAAAAAAGLLMDCDAVRLFHDHLLVKEPNTRAKTPWHQDQPYYNIEGKQNCSVWAPMDKVARAATLEFIAGTHAGPWLMPRSFMSSEAMWFPEGSLADLPDIEADRSAFNIIGWELEPGDAVFFHMLALHAAAGVSTGRRRVLSIRFMGDDITHAPRRWRTSPHFPGLEEELPAGSPMVHPLFPVLWEKQAAPDNGSAHHQC